MISEPNWKKKVRLSASTGGRGIRIVGTAVASATLVHTAVSSAARHEWDELWLYAVNTAATAAKLTLLWGGTTDPDDTIEITITPESGLLSIIPGLLLQADLQVKAFAPSGAAIVVHGYANRYQEEP